MNQRGDREGIFDANIGGVEPKVFSPSAVAAPPASETKPTFYYQLWQHQTSAEVWAVRWRYDGQSGAVDGACGPLAVEGLVGAPTGGGSLAHLSYCGERGAQLAAREEEYFPYAGCFFPECPAPAVVLGANGQTRACLTHWGQSAAAKEPNWLRPQVIETALYEPVSLGTGWHICCDERPLAAYDPHADAAPAERDGSLVATGGAGETKVSSPSAAGPDRALSLRYDGEYPFVGLLGRDSRCRLRLYAGAERPPVVIVTELADNPGTSVTNAAEELAHLVCRHYNLDEEFIWIEHYLDRGRRGDGSVLYRESFDQVQFAVHRRADGSVYFSDPEWRRVRREEVELLIGQELSD